MAELTGQTDEARGNHPEPIQSREKDENAARTRVDPIEEEKHWRAQYRNRGYAQEGADYGEFDEAYRYGWEAAEKPISQNGSWTGIEPQLEEEWGDLVHRGEKKKDWKVVREAVRDSYERVRERYAALAVTATSGPRDAGGYSIQSEPEQLPVDGKTIRKG